MKNNLEGQSKKILQVGFWFNLIVIIILLFNWSVILVFFLLLIDFILIGSYFILEKYSSLFELMIGNKKSSRILNNALGRLNG